MRSLHNLTATGILARRIGRALKRGLLLHSLFDRIRFGCFIMIILGPFFGVVEWHNQKRVEDILGRGATVAASVTKSKVTSGRSTTYTLDLAWRDANGTQHSVEQMKVSAAFFGLVTRRNPPPKVLIKYLTDRETTRRTVALLDDPTWKPNPANLLPAWTVPSLTGLIGLALLTLWRGWRRRRTAQMA